MEITTFPCNIIKPGRYEIVDNIVFSSDSLYITNLITVESCDVTIDLMGNSLSLSSDYNLRNRFFNLIYSDKDITVVNGTLGLCSGYSIESKSNVRCENVTFNSYELGAVKGRYVSLSNCNVGNPNLTNTTVNYDYARNLVVVCSNLISNYSVKLPINIVSQLTSYMSALETVLNFKLQSYYMDIYDMQYFTYVTYPRCKNIIDANKVKICGTQVNITSPNTFIYLMENVTAIDTNSVLCDITGLPVQYTEAILNQSWSTLIGYSSNVVSTYSLPYPYLPTIISSNLINQLSLPSGYISASIMTDITCIYSNDIKIYNISMSAINIIGIQLNNSRYFRCYSSSITSNIILNACKSIKMEGNTLNSLNIIGLKDIESTNNIIGTLTMKNVSNVVNIKSK